MAVPFSNTTLRVPPGFENLLEGLSREVLRMQPVDIYGFSATYFRELLKLREGIGDLAKLGAQFNDRFYNNKAFGFNQDSQGQSVDSKENYNKETEQQVRDVAATQIQSAFRGFRVRKSNFPNQQSTLPDEKAEDAIDQEIETGSPELDSASGGVEADQTLLESNNSQKDDQIEPEGVEIEAVKNQVEFNGTAPDKLDNVLSDSQVQTTDDQLYDNKADEAANRIQSEYRRYREKKKTGTKRSLSPAHQDSPEVVDNQRDEAATKIQAIYRGYRVRKTSVDD